MVSEPGGLQFEFEFETDRSCFFFELFSLVLSFFLFKQQFSVCFFFNFLDLVTVTEFYVDLSAIHGQIWSVELHVEVQTAALSDSSKHCKKEVFLPVGKVHLYCPLFSITSFILHYIR